MRAVFGEDSLSGKKLEHGGLKIPRWKNKYVNYNMLKKYIQQLQTEVKYYLFPQKNKPLKLLLN